MCRYACDLQPMLKVLAGKENIERLLNIDAPVRRISPPLSQSSRLQVNLSKLRYFYIDELDAYFVNKVDPDQKQAHRQVNPLIGADQ